MAARRRRRTVRRALVDLSSSFRRPAWPDLTWPCVRRRFALLLLLLHRFAPNHHQLHQTTTTSLIREGYARQTNTNRRATSGDRQLAFLTQTRRIQRRLQVSSRPILVQRASDSPSSSPFGHPASRLTLTSTSFRSSFHLLRSSLSAYLQLEQPSRTFYPNCRPRKPLCRRLLSLRNRPPPPRQP